MRRTHLTGLVGLAVTTASLAALGNTTSAAAPPTAAPDGDKGDAVAAAAGWVGDHSRAIRRTDGDAIERVAALPGANGTWSVAYDRTYRGLEVFGGDFVVMTDGEGDVLETSVAQRKPIELASTTPKISAAAASRAAASRFDKVLRSGTPEKIVYALGTPRLAWKVPVSGNQDGRYSGEDVYVDALTGSVIDYTVTVAHGTGDGFHSGPNPLSFRTTQSGSTFTMRDPSVPGLTCGQANGATRSVPVLSGSDDVWGQGNTSIETGCVDAMYSVQQMDGMLKSWLGRNSFKGDGTSWPIHVGLNDQNAFYCNGQFDCGGRNEVQFGKNPSGNWVSGLDVAGHEMGHGVDDYTPSGISRRGTQEFVGDVMGTLTEFYDNQPSPYDTPDWLIGEEVNLVGSGEIRNMSNPAAEGDPVCYTSAIDTTPVHTAAGPGDHWFYLLSAGGSSRCDGTNVPGIGIQKAGKIFYNAMLLKTTASSYPSYRTWTLQAAKTLHPTSCTEFNAVKTAWDAVNVPAQSGEPTCGTTTEPPPPPTGGNLLVNPGFESGATAWTGSSGPVTNSTGRPARTGSWKLWLGGNGRTVTETINQSVTIPSNVPSATLSYWIRTDTAESGSRVYDRMRVQVVNGSSVSTLRTFTNVGTNATYTRYTHDLSAYRGRTVTIRFTSTEDYTLQTSFVVDDTSVTTG